MMYTLLLLQLCAHLLADFSFQPQKWCDSKESSIIAAKSLLRFRDTDTAKTEYLFIGSFLSFEIAILLGIAHLVVFNDSII